jgi:eukaryotic-like serine/threonine-protein kinase
VLEPAAQNPAPHTVTALGAMTPEYASPEQVRLQPVEPASDVYSLGVLLYRLLTGRSPYETAAGTPHEITEAICRHDPSKPSRRVAARSDAAEDEDSAGAMRATLRGMTPAALSRRLAGDLDAIVLMALCKDPAHRYRSAAALAGDITRHLAGLPVKARHPGTAYRAWRLISRYRQPLAATGAILVALLTGALVGPLRSTVQQAEVPGSIGALAVLPFVNLSGHAEEEYLAQGMTEQLLSTLRRISSLRVVAQGSVARFRAGPVTPVQLAGLLGVDALVQGSVRRFEKGLAAEISVLRGSTGEVLWREQFERDLEHAHTLHRDVARAIAREFRVSLTASEQFRLDRMAAVEPDAFDEYLKGRMWSRPSTGSTRRTRNARTASSTST